MKKSIIALLGITFASIIYAQEQPIDSTINRQLNEVVLIGTKAQLHEKETKTLATIDQYLEQSPKIDMVKRGTYAWEPLINGMGIERTVITIDGMRIFGACTDKMDPVTSYVEVSNLSEAEISSGQQGACHGNTIGGSLNLKRNSNAFAKQGWQFAANSGYETNNKQQIIGAAINYADSLFFIDTDVMYRKAENYKSGGGSEILYSQFNKFNVSATTGVRLTKNQLIEGSVIFDKATDVGYPALPMDVSLAQALITSVKYQHAFKQQKINNWETKLYYNTITHTMDDTKRAFVPIHMDMPGWSDTYGWYSKVIGGAGKHHFTINTNGFYNKSLAEMTMYPANQNENLMFMYTWPDVRTLYAGIYVEDNWEVNCHSSFTFSTALGSHTNTVASEFGLQSLQIFYPEMTDYKSRFLKSFSARYGYYKNKWEGSASLGYGERAPSVSEGYGFYLFNSFDGFDYIGNPNLKKEQSIETSFSLTRKEAKWNAKLSASYFYIANYIVGIPDETIAPMTIGANGIKIYTAFDYATLFSTDFAFDYIFSKHFKWKTQLKYSLGKDTNGNGLPFMSPFAYNTSFRFKKRKLYTELQVQGNTAQTAYNSFYGEDKTPAYAVLNLGAGYKVYWESIMLNINGGVENVLDTQYSTFADWQNIPRMGRNFYLNLLFKL